MENKKREWLRELRQEKNLTQKEVAQEVGVQRHYYTNIENGKTFPSFELAYKLSRVLEFDLKNFFDTGERVLN